MKSFTYRRTVSLVCTLFIVVIIMLIWFVNEATIGGRGFVSGWTLCGMIIFLTLYNLRKKCPYLPLGSSSLWMQIHIYCGILTILIFLIHINISVPTGIFESMLALIYLLVFSSGVIGLFMTRTFPKRLTNLGDEVFFEYIPVLRRQLRDQIETLALKPGSSTEQTAIPEFYRNDLHQFVVSRPAVFSHLFGGTSKRWRAVQQSVADHRRYMNDDEQKLINEIEMLLRHKYLLDNQYVLQGALKVWLFIHIPTTYALLIFMFFHSLLVHAWSGGLS